MLNNQSTTPILVKDLGMMYPRETSKKKAHYGLYKCGCGKEFKTQIQSVNKGYTKSCGCTSNVGRAKAQTKHGLSKHRLWKTWQGMKYRCLNPKHKHYSYYGGRGITVCERWLDFSNFIEDMDSSYSEGLTLDRIDGSSPYCKNNCRWAGKTTQARNTKTLSKNNTTGYRGVAKSSNKKKFIAQITINYKNKFLGTFDTAFEAARAYDKYIVANNLEHTPNGVILATYKYKENR